MTRKKSTWWPLGALKFQKDEKNAPCDHKVKFTSMMSKTEQLVATRFPQNQ
jgi:hypothetical protein